MSASADSLKAKILTECSQTGTSVAGIAITGFIPMTIEPPPAAETSKEKHLATELHRAGLLMKLTWLLAAAEELSAWTSELLG